MDLDLDTLKHDMLQFLEKSGFAIFRALPGSLESSPAIHWDTERYPDYQIFLDVAKNAGAKMVLFASREFESSDIEEAVEQLEECELSREERREFEQRLRPARRFEGVTCLIELAFIHDSRTWIYELRPDWYEEFLGICDEIAVLLPDGEEEEDDNSIGGLYSNN